FFHYSAAFLHLHSFPTRRSSDLAVELRISRIPVLGAYSQLLAEGYFEARSGSGTFVSSSLPDQRLSLDRGNHIAQAFRPGRRLVDRKSTRLNSSHVSISYAVFCL